MKRPISRTLSLGKQRRMAQIADSSGRFALLAVDQRGNLRRAFAPNDPASVPYERLVEFKGQVAEAIGPHVTGILLDPEFGAAQAIRSGQIPGSCGLIVAVEETGYQGESHNRESVMISGFGAEKAVRMGASAAKLLLYFHPDAPRAAKQMSIVERVAEECSAAELPLIVEPLSFSADPVEPLSPAERTRVVIETARLLSALDIDMLKLEFPVNSLVDSDRSVWRAACEQVSSVSQVPWILLSAGVTFDLFAEQARIAGEAGASGVLAGRAVWSEATDLEGDERTRFLTGVASDRMERLAAIVDESAVSVNGLYGRPDPIQERWFEEY